MPQYTRTHNFVYQIVQLYNVTTHTTMTLKKRHKGMTGKVFWGQAHHHHHFQSYSYWQSPLFLHVDSSHEQCMHAQLIGHMTVCVIKNFTHNQHFTVNMQGKFRSYHYLSQIVWGGGGGGGGGQLHPCPIAMYGLDLWV